MRHYTFHGTPYETGCQLGSSLLSCGEHILEQIPFPVTRDRTDFAQACIPVYKNWYPSVLQELRGLSDTQRCSFDTLAGVLLPMYCLTPDAHCSCFAIRADGCTLLGRNSDFLTALADRNASCLFRGPRTVWGSTTAFIELEDGVNDSGLAVGLTSVQPPAPPRPGLNAGLLLRLLLENCAAVDDALELLRRVPAASSHTFVLADRSGEIALAECCGAALAVRRPKEDRAYVCAVNAFHLPEMASFVQEPADSWRSAERYATLAQTLPGSTAGVQDAMALLSGKKGFLCQYSRAFIGDTVWSVVYDLTHGETYLSEGNPGRTVFRRVSEACFA